MSLPEPKTILVSSAVYGFEPLLDQLYGILHTLGYEVWMSHRGTLPINPEKTALESCLNAVRQRDLYLGLILPRYGSGKETKESDSISHEELKLARRNSLSLSRLENLSNQKATSLESPKKSVSVKLGEISKNSKT